MPSRETPREAGQSPDEVEEFVCAVWAECLGIDAVGPDDAFTSLGGTSLQAQRVVARIASELPIDPGVSDVLAARTARDFAGTIRHQLTNLLEELSEDELSDLVNPSKD